MVLAPNDNLMRIDYTLASPPRGAFRVLLKCRVDTTDADPSVTRWGMGWTYGDKSYTPTIAQNEFYTNAADDDWEILDLGLLNIPPIAESDIAANSDFTLSMYLTCGPAGLSVGKVSDYEIDYIFLLPIDEGVVIVDDVAAADVLAIDNITNPNNVFITSATGLIENYPDYVGKPFNLGRETTRFYFLRDDGKTVTFTVDLKYQPLFLLI